MMTPVRLCAPQGSTAAWSGPDRSRDIGFVTDCARPPTIAEVLAGFVTYPLVCGAAHIDRLHACLEGRRQPDARSVTRRAARRRRRTGTPLRGPGIRQAR